MREAVLAYLIERQSVEGLTGAAMAQRMGVSETHWSHIRKGRAHLGVHHIERALELYPELLERIGKTQPEAVAS